MGFNPKSSLKLLVSVYKVNFPHQFQALEEISTNIEWRLRQSLDPQQDAN